MHSCLIQVLSDSAGTYTINLAEHQILKIGRKSNGEADFLELPYPEVSSQHAEIRVVGEVWMLIDLGSKNGTQLNGQSLTPGQSYRLNTGDKISVASHQLRIKNCSTTDRVDVKKVVRKLLNREKQ